MLRNVLDDYLDNLSDEREFDAPFLALLSAMGFYDIHFTHGQVEYGKDFIAKRLEKNRVVQYSFQCKRGDINQSAWRNEVQGQMLDAVLSSLSHPCFDTALPHQSVLVITGRLIGNAALGMQDFNKTLTAKSLRQKAVKLWDKPELISLLLRYGTEGIHQSTATGFISYGRFYIEYGKGLSGNLTDHEIENYSLEWTRLEAESVSKILVAILEAETLASTCRDNGKPYEAAQCILAAMRATMYTLHSETGEERRQWLTALYHQILLSLCSYCEAFVSACRRSMRASGGRLLDSSWNEASIVTYPVHAARLMETTGLLYFLTKNPSERMGLGQFLGDFVSSEIGCSHIISDKYAVSFVPVILALHHSGRTAQAQSLIRQAVVWLCDRYERGFGLAPFGALETEQVSTLLGYPFSSIRVTKNPSSFAATVLSDLSAWLGNEAFYGDVVNDFKACDIAFSYWQPQDSPGQFLIAAEDVIQYPNIEYQGKIGDFETLGFASHVEKETRTFTLSEALGPVGHLGLTLLLRDRYFPSIWSRLS